MRRRLTFARLVAILGSRDQAARLVAEAAGHAIPCRQAAERFVARDDRDRRIRSAFDAEVRGADAQRVVYQDAYREVARSFDMSVRQVERICSRAD